MFLDNNIRYEAAMLPFLLILTVFLYTRYATKAEVNRRFRALSLSTLLAASAGILSHMAENTGILSRFPALLLFTVYYALTFLNAYHLLRYVSSYVQFENKYLLFISRAVLIAGFTLLLINMPSHFMFSVGEGGTLIRGGGFTTVRAVIVFFFLFTAFALQNIFQRFYENAQFILVNLVFFLLIDAFIVQYLFARDILIVYVVSTALLFVTFFYLEAPTLRALTQTEEEMMHVLSDRQGSIDKETAASRAKSDFLANTSHELRTPMNAILGMNDMILKEAEDEETLHAAQDIRQAGQNLLGIINNILDIAKIESGKMEIYPVDFFLSEVIDDITAQIAERAKEKGLTLEVMVNKELPEHLHGDEDALRRILLNLLDNAVKYTEKGGITFRVLGGGSAAKLYEETPQEAKDATQATPKDHYAWLVFANGRAPEVREDTEKPKAPEKRQKEEEPSAAESLTDEEAASQEQERMIHLQFSVEDTGIGMRKEEMNSLFDAFERVNYRETQSIQGAGLGLTLVAQFTRLMGGNVRAESVYGEGSVFTVDLPMRVVTEGFTGSIAEYEAQARQELELSQAQGGEDAADAPGTLPDLTGKRLLIVDDTPVNLVVAKSMLELTGARIDSAMSGEEALDMAIGTRYDLIFLDHLMPGMDGVETFRKLRAYGADGSKKNESGKTPVIALTANAGAGARALYKKEGFDGYLEKPLREEALARLLRE